MFGGRGCARVIDPVIRQTEGQAVFEKWSNVMLVKEYVVLALAIGGTNMAKAKQSANGNLEMRIDTPLPRHGCRRLAFTADAQTELIPIIRTLSRGRREPAPCEIVALPYESLEPRSSGHATFLSFDEPNKAQSECKEHNA